MGLWSAYFFAKLLLYAGGFIGFNVWLNLAFAIFTALPPQNPRQRFAKNVIAVPLAILLLYHDSWLPPIARVLSQAHALSSFTLPYVLELLGRFINWKVIAALAVMGFIYALARRKLRLSTFVFIAIIGVMVAPEGGSVLQPSVAGSSMPAAGAARPQIDARNMRADALNTLLTRFNAQEQQRQVRFQAPAADDEPFDILLLHVCSLSWDDLQAAHAENDPLFKRFDIQFSQFNSAASYSGPAALRLLRGNCGATDHKQLYEPANRECLVIDGLQDAGFEPHWLMNHDGHFGNFFADVRDRAGFPATPDDSTAATVAQHAFDGSPIYDDYSTLSRWWATRSVNPAPRVVLYYNTISLHDGNRVNGKADSSYAARLAQFTTGVGRFLDDLQRSGRRVVVVFIPEHGAALRGDRKQIPGLREIPTPAITRVPVGVVLVNASRNAQTPSQRVETPTSYLAVNELLSRFLTDNPFAKSNLTLSTYTQGLPQTDFVAENDGTVMMGIGTQYMMRTPDGAWSGWN